MMNKDRTLSTPLKGELQRIMPFAPKEISEEITKEEAKLAKAPLPNRVLMGRGMALQLVEIADVALSHLRKKATDEVLPERGEYLGTDGRIKQVGRLHIISIILAILKKLSNDSQMTGNNNFSGVFPERKPSELPCDMTSASNAATLFLDHTPLILITRNELLEFMSDKSSESKRAIEAALQLLDNAKMNVRQWRYLTIWDTNSEVEKMKPSGKPITYTLALHPFFSNALRDENGELKNFGYLTQTAGDDLNKAAGKGKTAEDILLITILIEQDKRQPFRRTIKHLIEAMDMGKEVEGKDDKEGGIASKWKHDRSRTEDRLYKSFEYAKKIRILSHFEFYVKKGTVTKNLQPPFSDSNRPTNVVAYFDKTYACITPSEDTKTEP